MFSTAARRLGAATARSGNPLAQKTHACASLAMPRTLRHMSSTVTGPEPWPLGVAAAPDVVDSINDTVDTLKTTYPGESIELGGFCSVGTDLYTTIRMGGLYKTSDFAKAGGASWSVASTKAYYHGNHSPNIKYLGTDHMALAQPSSARVLVVKPADPDTVVATLEVPSGSTWTTAVGTGHDECATYFNAVEPEFFPSDVCGADDNIWALNNVTGGRFVMRARKEGTTFNWKTTAFGGDAASFGSAIGIGNVGNDIYVAEATGQVRKFNGETGIESSSFTLPTGITYSDVHTVTPTASGTIGLGNMYIFTEALKPAGTDQRVYIYAPDSDIPVVDKNTLYYIKASEAFPGPEVPRQYQMASPHVGSDGHAYVLFGGMDATAYGGAQLTGAK